MNRIMLSSAIILVLGTTPVLSQQGSQFSATGPGSAPLRRNGDIDQVAMIHSLVRFGINTEMPLALVTAAQILLDHPVTVSDQRPQEKTAGPPPADLRDQSNTPRVRLEPLPLLEAARNMPSDDDHVRALIDAVAARADAGLKGAVGGPVVRYGRLLPGYYHWYDVTFQGNQGAQVVVSGDGRSNVDCHAYAQDGSLIDSDENPTDVCLLDWWENWTGVVRVEIHARGAALNDYILVTN